MARRTLARTAAQRRTPRARTHPARARTRSRPRGRWLYRRPLRLEPLEDRCLLAVVTVDTLSDTVDFTDGVTSLREAIFATNTVPGADTIEFAPSLTAAGPATIILTQGELVITDSLTINGPGADLLTIDASGNDPTPDMNNGDGSRVFNIDDDDAATFSDVSMSGLTLTGGDVGGNGGAILSFEVLSISQSVGHGNSARSNGGGVAQYGGDLTIIQTTLSENSAVWRGGSVFFGDFDPFLENKLSIHDTTIADNNAVAGGGGLWVQMLYGSLTLEGNEIARNAAGGSGGRGGGAYISARSAPVVISGNSIRGNTAGSGGGAWISTVFEQTLIVDNVISGNNAIGFTGTGGGVYLTGDAAVSIVRSSIIEGNSAGQSGGGIGGGGDRVVIESSLIASNTAGRMGGGISSSSRLEIIRSTIRDNRANGSYFSWNGGGGGGGILSFGELIVAGTIISGNLSPGVGGGILSAGNIAVTDSSISGNSAYSGGGIWQQPFRDITVHASSIIGNHATNEGGGIWGRSGDLTVANSTISGNVAAVGGGVFGESKFQFSTITDNDGGGINGNVALKHSIVAGNRGIDGSPLDVTGVVNAEFSLVGFGAEFLGPLADNGGFELPDGSRILTHALLAGSPAISAGDPNAQAGVDGVPVHDQRGAPFTRVYGGRIDIGAVEAQPVDVLGGDYNGDGVADAADYTAWRDTLGQSVANGSGADGNGDGVIDLADQRLWAANFGATTADLPVQLGAASGGQGAGSGMQGVASEALGASQQTERGRAEGVRRKEFGPLRHALILGPAPRPAGAGIASRPVAARPQFAGAPQDHALLAWLAARHAAERRHGDGVDDVDARASAANQSVDDAAATWLDAVDEAFDSRLAGAVN
jgi:hypothetical protein